MCLFSVYRLSDASDAVRGRDGYSFEGYALRVEFPRGGGGGYGGGNNGGGFNSFKRGGMGRNSTGGPPRRSDFRVIVTGLPPTGSWQDLKDHMREAGDVGYTDVFRDGTGVVEFLRYEDMKYAIRRLDDSKFRSHEVSISLTFIWSSRASHRTYVFGKKSSTSLGLVLDPGPTHLPVAVGLIPAPAL